MKTPSCKRAHEKKKKSDPDTFYVNIWVIKAFI